MGDPDMIRLNIYAASAHFELRLPLLQVAKRAWETGKMATEEFREALKEPHLHLQEAERLLENETNENLPEGQLRETNKYINRVLMDRQESNKKLHFLLSLLALEVGMEVLRPGETGLGEGKFGRSN